MMKVLKASAGSGKTYSLTKEYLMLLFMSGSDTEYRHILAVTFTNKATDEMKVRILKELDKLAKNPAESDYYDDIVEHTAFKTEEKVGSFATGLLENILHDYSRFSVCTIDKFFQRTMRSFAREIGQSSSYQVELDGNSVVDAALDRIYASLGEPENAELLEILTYYAEDLVRDGMSWDFNVPLESVASTFLNEGFKIKASGNDIGGFDIRSVWRELDRIKGDFKSELRGIGSSFLDDLGRAGLIVSDLIRGSRSPFFYFSRIAAGFVEAPSGTLMELAGNPEGWAAKKSPKREDIECAASSMCHYITDADDLFKAKFGIYSSAVATGESLYALTLFSALRKEMQEVLREKDSILLSDTPDVLNRIIGDEDAPFIYEKIGVRFNHYMLDEFQDTSLLQWRNFKPLIRESLASGEEDLVVGDVKQSIYRWRGSDWSLLRDIGKQFGDLPVEVGGLRTNYRSAWAIVDFNNAFFDGRKVRLSAPRQLQDKFDLVFPSAGIGTGEITGMYSDSVQLKAPNNEDLEGHVLVEEVPLSEGKDYTLTEDLHAIGGKKALEYIKKLTESGYEYRDMALLSRSNAEVAELSKLLTDEGIPVFTEESLELGSSPAVQRVVSALRFLTDSESPLNIYLTKGRMFGNTDIKSMSLYNAVLSVIEAERNISENDVAFLNSFLDAVSDFIRSNSSDPVAFLAWWDEEGRSRKISSPSGCNAVSVMTVHKAKGLQYKVVIIPFFLFRCGIRKNHTIWCSPSLLSDQVPFNSIPVAPIKCSDALMGSIYSDDYRREILNTYIDSLNTAYVVCTRAVNELIIIAPRNSRDCCIANMLTGFLRDFGPDFDEKGIFEKGNWTHGKVDAEGASEAKESLQSTFTSVPIGERLKLTLRGGDFFGKGERMRGIIRHDIMSKINTAGDIGDALDYFVFQGELGPEDKEPVGNEITGLLDSVRERHWFDGTYDVRNEAEILSGDAVYRPDRVMVSKDGRNAVVVDYKFGDEKGGYLAQVRNYVELLKAMGYESVQGYLWYCPSGKIIMV
ncbi:MAG: UvrD-helicase domain-containing protein [Bacteroidales bacterium]|jgi:superfamily I DNA/RNA helicase|nr:UvrD-helicase domain-containing protein [Bacteroidales bacterium]MCI2121805.1 UvrD-helicase domain-containing protein [Bacteroidales bacterium]MCI2144669.1 UvrD-helicase domain-containing protein [Bacteroidales bacterium]